MRIVVLDDRDRAFADSPLLGQLQDLGEVIIYADSVADRDEVLSRLQPAEVAILIRERTALDRSMLEQLPNLKFIAQTGGGAAHIDHEAREERGIGIAYTPGSSKQSVVELTFGLAIAALRDIPRHDRQMRLGEWPQEIGRTLRGKRLSIIGFGRIGSALVPAAQVFGMNVLAWGQERSRERAEEIDIPFTDDLTEAMGSGDVISVNLGLRAETRGIIQGEHLDALRPGSVLINTARGAVVDEAALIVRLRKRDIAAALDVFHDEPLPAVHPLRSMENVILSPHIGWITDDNYHNVVAACIENIRHYQERAEG